ncbi:hypothetical protein BDK51DRAFT_40460 [Blyttiomyces helicus]|uniref:Uncharacterized protein n=1 Tax=Blyttiomyces helicus TaxID=388810 RepID=A0A4P9WQW6_9FUNG|nr:hypothetical protein BDK51DRAFT_40460 [Blyttiomyces helicus]|eukprot:RKO93276.1 hypothetical protein BDK51DRAFT_40460 [Blyttiomyces helicus]
MPAVVAAALGPTPALYQWWRSPRARNSEGCDSVTRWDGSRRQAILCEDLPPQPMNGVLGVCFVDSPEDLPGLREAASCADWAFRTTSIWLVLSSREMNVCSLFASHASLASFASAISVLALGNETGRGASPVRQSPWPFSANTEAGTTVEIAVVEGTLQAEIAIPESTSRIVVPGAQRIVAAPLRDSESPSRTGAPPIVFVHHRDIIYPPPPVLAEARTDAIDSVRQAVRLTINSKWRMLPTLAMLLAQDGKKWTAARESPAARALSDGSTWVMVLSLDPHPVSRMSWTKLVSGVGEPPTHWVTLGALDGCHPGGGYGRKRGV